MAYNQTTHLLIKKPIPGTNQPFETSVMNENWDKVDNIYDRIITIEADGQAQIDAFDIAAAASLNTFETQYTAALATLDTAAILAALDIGIDIDGGTA